MDRTRRQEFDPSGSYKANTEVEFAMQISATLAGQEVRSSGAFILSEHQNTFSIIVDDVSAVFEFEGEENNPSISFKLDGSKKLVITLQNWNNPLGTSYVFDDIFTVETDLITIGIYALTIGNPGNLNRSVTYSVTSRTGVSR